MGFCASKAASSSAVAVANRPPPDGSGGDGHTFMDAAEDCAAVAPPDLHSSAQSAADSGVLSTFCMRDAILCKDHDNLAWINGDEGDTRPSDSELELEVPESLWRRRNGVSGDIIVANVDEVKRWRPQLPKGSITASSLHVTQEEFDVLQHLLSTHPFFAACRDDTVARQEMMLAFERQETAPGELITAPGDDGVFHLVVSGMAQLEEGFRAVGEGSPKGSSGPLEGETAGVQRQWKKGDFFGSKSLLYLQAGNRSASPVRAAGPPEERMATVTWRLNHVRYQQLMRLFHDFSYVRFSRHLSHSPLFGGLSFPELWKLCQNAQLVAYDVATCLQQSGKVPADLHLLLSGTVAVKRDRASNESGDIPPSTQTPVLRSGDCVGDVELLLPLLPHHSRSEEAGASENKQKYAALPSAYTYTTQDPVEAIRLAFDALRAVLSEEDLLCLRERSHAIQCVEQHQQQRQESRHHLIDSSCSPDAENRLDEEEREDAKVVGGSHGAAVVPFSTMALLQAMGDKVWIKDAAATTFLLAHLFSRPPYERSDGRERGLAVAAFTPLRSYPSGTVLYDVSGLAEGERAAGKGACGAVVPPAGGPAQTLVRAGLTARLYLVASGEITVVDTASGRPILRLTSGDTVGEDAVISALPYSAAGPQHTLAFVSSAEGCEVYELNARAYRQYLLRPYSAALQEFYSHFCILPYAECFPESYWRHLFHCCTERVATASDLLAVRGNPVKAVSLLLYGEVGAYVLDNMVGAKAMGSTIATFAAGDVIGGWEVTESTPARVAYVCECRCRMLSIPAESFESLFRPAQPYLRFLWSQERYQNIQRVPCGTT